MLDYKSIFATVITKSEQTIFMFRYEEYFSKYCPFNLDFGTLIQFVRKKRKLIGLDDYSYPWPILDRNIILRKKSLSRKRRPIVEFCRFADSCFFTMAYLSLSEEIWQSVFLGGRKKNGFCNNSKLLLFQAPCFKYFSKNWCYLQILRHAHPELWNNDICTLFFSKFWFSTVSYIA